MSICIKITITVIAALVFVISLIFSYIQSRSPKNPIHPLPDKIPILKSKDLCIVDCYLKEWEVVIKTQMHFNDLIIKFRSIILTSFATLIGAAIVVFKIYDKFDATYFMYILIVVGILWILAFFLDYFYYHHLLLGAVLQAKKYDESAEMKKLGLFGLSECITKNNNPLIADILIYAYYFVPLLLMIMYIWIY